MSNPFNGPVSRLWLSWKSLNLPWRKQRLAGYDLNGNTFWEFKDTVRSNRWRRIARQPRTIDYADIQISPQWHQWLRRTRLDAPSVQEQQADVQRQVQIKELAQLADTRWANQQSYIQGPTAALAASAGSAGAGGRRSEDPETNVDGRRLEREIRPPEEKSEPSRKQRERREDPWARHGALRNKEGGEGEWQPGAWKPGGGT